MGEVGEKNRGEQARGSYSDQRIGINGPKTKFVQRLDVVDLDRVHALFKEDDSEYYGE